MESFRPERVYNGTWGFVYIDGYKLAEVTAFSATIEQETEDVNQAQTLAPGKKPSGLKCEGSVKMHKVSPYMRDKCSDKFKAGKIVQFTIVGGINDPDAAQSERIIIKDATVTKLTLMDWELKKLGEEEIPFSFTDWEVVN
ncbi:MAG: phage tail tube protein [Clostridiales bacterium]